MSVQALDNIRLYTNTPLALHSTYPALLRYTTLTALLLSLLLSSCERSPIEGSDTALAPYLEIRSDWVDSLMEHMTLEQKVGQLIFYRPTNLTPAREDTMYQAIWDGHVGGVLFPRMRLQEYIRIADSSQSLASVPLLIGTEQNVLLNNQFSDITQFPNAATISSVRDDVYEEELNQRFVRQCRSVGVNFSLAPNVNRNLEREDLFDISAYGDEAGRVMQRAESMMRAMQLQRILSIARPFSRYDWTSQDTLHQVDSVLLRYKLLAEQGLSGFYIDDQLFRIDTLERMPRFFLRNFMSDKLNFHGLLVGSITDSTNLDRLLYAGVDVFIIRNKPEQAHNYIVQYVREGLLTEKELNEKVEKVLLAKSWTGLEQLQNISDAEAIYEEIEFGACRMMSREIYENSITVVHNEANLIPFGALYNRDFRIVQVGSEPLTTFKGYFRKYATYRSAQLEEPLNGRPQPLDVAELATAGTVVITIDRLDLDEQVDEDFYRSINNLDRETQVVVVNFGNPLNLRGLSPSVSIVQAYERNFTTESITAQVLFGGIGARGKLPVSVAANLPYGAGDTTPVTRFEFAIPEDVGMSRARLSRINTIVLNAIRRKAMPGCQVLVAKDNKIIFDRTYGYHTYTKEQRVLKNDLYDIASVTKVAATTLAAMKLYEDGRMRLSDRVRAHYDCLTNDCRIQNLTIAELLTHRTGLQPNMPVLKHMQYTEPQPGVYEGRYAADSLNGYRYQIADGLWFSQDYYREIWEDVEQLKSRRRGRYRYSDVNFNILQRLLEKEAETSLDDYLELTFYRPMGLRHTLYKPLQRFTPNRIAPTQDDKYWRRQLLRGYPHDESAALLGGVAGNAGLFATSTDLAVIFQMMLNGGTYGGQQYLDERTVQLFTKEQRNSSRGYGFDLKSPKSPNCRNRRDCAPIYGHYGFAGTCVWVDPEENLIYIFLSNRIHPDVSNTKLATMQIREKIHAAIYNAIDTYCYDCGKLNPT